MPAVVPVPGFIELLQSYERFQQTAQYVFFRVALRHGLVPEMNDTAMRKVHCEWREAVVGWDGKTNELGAVSHIKMAGFLLWAFNEQEGSPVVGCRPFQEHDQDIVGRLGLAPNVVSLHQNGSVLRAFPTQALGFILVAAVFGNVQRGRQLHGGMKVRVDWSNPPMTRHFLHNLCWYLYDHFPSKESLYMIFKSFDLYGMVLPFDGRPAEG